MLYRFKFFPLVAMTAFLSLGASLAQDSGAEPEEPDFFFLTGGPYTQQKDSPQIIWSNQWFRHTAAHNFVSAGRVEYGLTGRIEADLEFGAQSTRHNLAGLSHIEREWDVVMLGVRYRLLTEESSPLTLTLGPQLTLPPGGAPAWETGASHGVDVTAAKDWGGPIFVAASLNWHVTPGVRPAPDTAAEVTLNDLSCAVALGFRPLEKATPGNTKHDIHLFVEALATKEDTVEDGRVAGQSQYFLAPGFRYGFVNRRGTLAELGVSLPLGLNHQAPDWGLIVQFQIELPSLFNR